MAAGEHVSRTELPHRVFTTTRWTVVLQAGGPTSPGSAAALDQLCRSYWHPLYHYARRSGLTPTDAEDLTQSFFAHLLEKDVIARADPQRGRFRTFLLCSFRNFQSNHRAHAAAGKRGGGQPVISLDELEAEHRYHALPSALSPEKLYDQQWAASLLAQVMRNLQAEYTALNKGPLFKLLRQVLLGEDPATGYGELARVAGISEGAFKVAVHRLRHRYREALRQEVAQTVATPGEVEDELRHLLSTLEC